LRRSLGESLTWNLVGKMIWVVISIRFASREKLELEDSSSKKTLTLRRLDSFWKPKTRETQRG
jgi:hypothetical protein